MASIFLSHSWSDKVFARKLAKRLGQEGVTVWIDEAQINIGDSLIQKISEGIEYADYVAAVISAKSVQSEWVQKELRLAMTKEIKGKKIVVLPLLVEHCDLPSFLKDKVYADFTKPKDFNQGFLKLLKVIGIDEAKTYIQQKQRRSPSKSRYENQVVIPNKVHSESSAASGRPAVPPTNRDGAAGALDLSQSEVCHSCGAAVAPDENDHRAYHCSRCGASDQWWD